MAVRADYSLSYTLDSTLTKKAVTLEYRKKQINGVEWINSERLAVGLRDASVFSEDVVNGKRLQILEGRKDKHLSTMGISEDRDYLIMALSNGKWKDYNLNFIELYKVERKGGRHFGLKLI